MKYLLTLLLLATSLISYSAIGDTTTIIAHDNEIWTWYGNKDVKAGFPTETKSYEKVLLEFEIWCPEDGCSEWDYFTKFSARLETGTDTSHSYDSNQVLTIDTFTTYTEVELARYITPYAGNYDENWYRSFKYDVTDFQSILKDSLIIRAFYDGWQAGWKFNTKFHFIEGTPARNVIGFEKLWNGRYEYGDPAKPIAQNVLPTTVAVHEGAKQAKLRVITTGHRFGGSENCAEFCIKTHEFHVNDAMAFEQTLWNDNCGMNPEYPQAGTWLYDRAGWCPGAPVEAYEYNMTNYISGDSVKVDYQFDYYAWDSVNPPAPSYYIGAAVVYYGDYNFTNDAAVEDIISPSAEFEHSRYNPICTDPVIVIKNNGSANLTHALIRFGVEGAEIPWEFEWTGNLAALETDTITLYKSEDRTWLWNGADSNSQFFAEIVQINNTWNLDEYAHNNKKMSAISIPPMYPKDFTIRFKTNGAATDTKVKIYNNKGEIVYENPIMDARTTLDTEVSLNAGCYVLEVTDSAENGTDFWANNDGKGKLEFRSPESGLKADLKEFEMDFGTAFYHHFMVGYQLDIEELENNTFLAPNPSGGIAYVHSDLQNVQGIRVYNSVGQIVKNYPVQFIPKNGFRMDLKIFSGQLLYVEIHSEKGSKVMPLIVK